MQNTVISTESKIPYLMSAKHLQQMGIARNMAYNLFNTAGFPVVQIGNRKIVRKDDFFKWLDDQRKMQSNSLLDD